MDDTISSFGTFASPIKANSKLNDFKILCKLGEGSFSTVYKVQRLADNKIYAMKKVLMSRLNNNEKANSLNEIRILASIHSNHVIEYRDSFFDESSDQLCIVMEYAGEGDLLSKLKIYKDLNQKIIEKVESIEQCQSTCLENKEKKEENIESANGSHNKKKRIYKKLNQQVEISLKQNESNDNLHESTQNTKNQKVIFMEEEMIWDYFLQCIKGLKCLHDMKILHRDLKCANIFISEHNIVKIGDLNVSKVTQRAEQMAKTQTGTPYYTAPEVWKGQAYNHKSDVWSLGCIIYELCSQKHPFKGNTVEGLYTNIMKGEYERIPKFYSNEMEFVISQCLQQNPNLRLSCDQLLKLPAFISRFQRYEEQYKPYLQNNQKSKYQCQNRIITNGIQNQLTVPVQSYLEFTPQRSQRTNTENHFLLDTINVPSNMKQLSNLLPKSNYEEVSMLLPSICEFEESIIVNHIPHNKNNVSNKKNSTQMITEFEQVEKISSVQSSSSSSSNLKFPNQQQINEKQSQNEQQANQLQQNNIFQVLLNLKTENLIQYYNYQQTQQTEQKQSNYDKEKVNYHISDQSPILKNLQRVQMDNSYSVECTQLQCFNDESKKQNNIIEKNDDGFQKYIVQNQIQKNNQIINQQCTETKINTNINHINKNGIEKTLGQLNLSSIENKNIQNHNEIQNQLENESQDPLKIYMKKLRMRPQTQIRNNKKVESSFEIKNNEIQRQSQQNLEKQQSFQDSTESQPLLIAPILKYLNNSSNYIQTQSSNEENITQRSKLNVQNGYYDVRNNLKRYQKQGSKDYQRQIHQQQSRDFLKTEEDSPGYSPATFNRGLAAPRSDSTHNKGQKYQNNFSSQSQQHCQPFTNQIKSKEKSISPKQRVSQYTQLMKRYLPKLIMRNKHNFTQERNNSSNPTTSAQCPTQCVKIHNIIPQSNKNAPNSAKYPSHKIVAVPIVNNSLISQQNNSFQNYHNNISISNGTNNQNNYSLNQILNSSFNTPPLIKYNKENVNNINILNNSFGQSNQQSKQTSIKVNNAVKAVQYSLPTNTNHIQIAKKLGNIKNIIEQHSQKTNRFSPPKQPYPKQQLSRKNIFYCPNNINDYQDYINSTNINKVYTKMKKNLNQKQNTSINEGSFQDRKSIIQILRC